MDVNLCSLMSPRLLQKETSPRSLQLLHSLAIAVHLCDEFQSHMKCLNFLTTNWIILLSTSTIFLVSSVTQHSYFISWIAEKILNSGTSLFRFALLLEIIQNFQRSSFLRFSSFPWCKYLMLTDTSYCYDKGSSNAVF